MNSKTGMATIFFAVSVLAVVLSALVSVLKMHLWLAGSQWMLLGIVFGVYAVFFKMKSGE
jgi:hypothetical protein